MSFMKKYGKKNKMNRVVRPSEPIPMPQKESTTIDSSLTDLDPRLKELLQMFCYKRPMNSYSEAAFVARFLKPLGVESDEKGNLHLQVGDASPEILWSSHIDTVHSTPGYQKVYYGDNIASSDSGECLGGDCTAGVWLMMQMIRANIPGLYIFHYGEERGGLGSTYISTKTPHILKGIKAAIAFDRKGKGDVITHQGFRCCSDTFAKSLSTILGGEFKPCSNGIFTDTANYTDDIGECTNISVGYNGAHTKHEIQDCRFLLNLCDTLIAADWSKLVYERTPGEKDDDYGFWENSYGGSHWSGHYGNSNYIPSNTTKEKYFGPSPSYLNSTLPVSTAKPTAFRGNYTWPSNDLVDFVETNPALVSMFLEECGYNVYDLEKYAKTCVLDLTEESKFEDDPDSRQDD